MGTECVQPSLRESCDANLGIPSASLSIIPLTLEKASDDDVICLGSSNATDSVRMQNDNSGSVVPKEKSRKSLRNRPCINYSQFDNSSDEETVPELVYHDIPPRSSLRKGVLRGCPDCATCQKVLARWHPQDACRPSLDEAPVFYPNEDEFKDTLKYIESIHAKAESYGICKIVPPPSWKPPCPLKEKVTWENSKFNTRVQRVDLLQNRKSVRQMCRGRGKKRRINKPGLENGNNDGHILKADEHHHHSIGDNFGFESGPSFSLDSFQKYADDFKRQYFSKRSITESMGQIHSQEQPEPSVENIEGEYWRVVEKPTEEIEVLYGADLETGDFSSGFPRVATSTSDSLENEYLKSGWNLNKFPRLPGSVLSFEEEDISGVLVPWLYVGMCFSSFCWHVEDHHFYSLNYMHLGAPKMWYGVPGKEALQLEAAMKKHLPDLFEEQPDLLHNLVTQFSPSILKSEGVPVYRCVQNPGEFVLTFPRAYHSGFNCGFNCAEAVNVAPVDWLPHGQNAVELYRDQGRKISVSHDKLLLGAAREAVKAQWDILFLKKTTPYSMLWKNICGPDKVLVRSLKARIEMEQVRREPFSTSQSRKMEADFNPNGDKECFKCHYDLYLSAAGCSCSPDKLACLNHAKQICSCDWSMKFLLYRYQIAELNVLVDALGGKLSAVHKWGISDLGLSLRKYVSKQKTQEKASSGETSPERGKEKPKESLPSCNKQQTGLHHITPTKKESEMTHETSLEKEKDCPVSQTKEESSVSHAMACPSFRKEAPHGTPIKGARQEQNQTCQPITKVEDTPVNFDKGTTRLSDKVRNSMCLDGKECKEPSCTGTDEKEEEFIKKHSEAPVRTTDYEDNTTPDHKDQVSNVSSSAATSKTESGLFPPIDGTSLQPASLPIKQGTAEKATPYHKDRVSNVSTSAVTSKTESGLFPPVDGTSLLPASLPKVKEEKHGEILRENVYSPFGTSFYLKEESHDLSNTRNVTNPSLQFPASNQMGHFDNFNHEKKLHGANPYNCVNPMDVSEGGNLWPNHIDRRNDGRWPIPGKQYCPPTDSERCNFQRGSGPRIAKVVRRINCIVEALEFGIVLPGSLWCNSQAIFPKGYRSRVRYLSVLDPSQTCNYVSEILDGGSHGPLFMVQVEQQPSEVFIHLSAHKCWDLVRERVNHEIRRLQSLGRLGIPTLQLPGSVDGLEMFGLTSPAIVKEIEAIDYNRVSFESWRSRPQINNPVGFIRDPRLRLEEAAIPNKALPSSSDTILQGLFKKANTEELQILHRLLTNDRFGINQGTSRLLNEEMVKCSRSSTYNFPG